MKVSFHLIMKITAVCRTSQKKIRAESRMILPYQRVKPFLFLKKAKTATTKYTCCKRYTTYKKLAANKYLCLTLKVN